MHNQVGTGIRSQKTIPSEAQQTEISQTMAEIFTMRKKGSRRVPTTTNRKETWTDKVDQTAALHTGQWENKWFSPSADEHAAK